jgi:hypothetical protein
VSNGPRSKSGTKLLIGLLSVGFLAGGFIAVRTLMDNEPPESSYTQAEAYAPMERGVADIVSVLPDFPGFVARSWDENPCSHEGIDDDRYTDIEITYAFGREHAQDSLIREVYVDVLRDHWRQLGYEIYLDETNSGGSRTDRSIAARRDDGVSFWYRAWGRTTLIVQSGCVPRSDKSEIDYIPPAGGVVPGGEGDGVNRYFPDGIPVEDGSPSAIDPFDERGLNPFRD